MEELTENAEEGDEEDKQSEQKLGRLNFKVSSRVYTIPYGLPSDLQNSANSTTNGLQNTILTNLTKKTNPILIILLHRYCKLSMHCRCCCSFLYKGYTQVSSRVNVASRVPKNTTYLSCA